MQMRGRKYKKDITRESLPSFFQLGESLYISLMHIKKIQALSTALATENRRVKSGEHSTVNELLDSRYVQNLPTLDNHILSDCANRLTIF
jgi:hypothetical protein